MMSPLLLLLSLSCARLHQLEADLAEVQAANAVLEERISALEIRRSAAPSPPPPDETAAQALYERAMELYQQEDYLAARELLRELEAQHGDSNTARRAKRTLEELEVFGKAAPGSLHVERWFQGQGVDDLHSSKPTILIFWEAWCPHCRREVPNINDTYLRYRDQGLNVVGLTRVTRSSTEEKVEEFLSENAIAFPIGKEDGASSDYFSIRGIPAVAVLKDGEVVWRGHPARITEDMLDDWLR